MTLKVSTLVQNNGQLGWLPKNPRQWTQTDIDRTAASIREDEDFLEDRPLLVVPKDAKTWVVFAGNLRLTAAKKIGLKEVPCIAYARETDEDEMTIKRRAMKDNGSFGAWDYDALANEWDDLPLADFGVPVWDASSDMKLTTEGREGGEGGKEQHQCENREDNTDGMTVEKRAFPGAIFALDGHRLMCGDATDPAAYDALLNAAGVEKVDLALTDPPYGIDVVKKKERDREGIGGGNVASCRHYAKIAGDESTDVARVAFDMYKELANALVIFGGNYFTDFLPPSRCWIVWDKVNGENDFADVELAWASIDKSARLFRHVWNGMTREGDHEAEGKTRLHPTQKPVGLLTAIVEKLFPDAQTILDPFGGSGSTLIAADRLGKRCFMMELSVDYVEVILARWERFTGKKSQLITPGDKVS